MASPPRSPARRCAADTLIDAQPTSPRAPRTMGCHCSRLWLQILPLAHPSPTTGAHRLTNPSPHYRCPPPRRLRLWCTARCTTPSTCPSSTTGASEAGGSAAARHDSSAREREWRTERRGPSSVDPREHLRFRPAPCRIAWPGMDSMYVPRFLSTGFQGLGRSGLFPHFPPIAPCWQVKRRLAAESPLL